MQNAIWTADLVCNVFYIFKFKCFEFLIPYTILFALSHNIPQEWSDLLKSTLHLDQHEESDKKTHRE